MYKRQLVSGPGDIVAASVASIDKPIWSLALNEFIVLPENSVSTFAVKLLVIDVLLIGVVFWLSLTVTSVLVLGLP